MQPAPGRFVGAAWYALLVDRQLRRRFDRKVVWTPNCWFWIGAIGDDGYGRFAAAGGHIVRAHRWLWTQDVGPLPPSVPLRHVCDETSCVRLEHLLAGTHQLNMTDMRLRGRAGGPRAGARTDIRGPAGRARAIRTALQDGLHPAKLDAAIAAGEPWRHQLPLFV